MPTTLLPRHPAPALELETVAHGTWRLADQAPGSFTLVLFYRRLHCPICSDYVPEFEARLEEFARRGVEVVAVSADPADRAATTAEDWGLARVPVAYGLTPEQMDAWGLYVSAAIKEQETDVFAEPAAFLVGADGNVWLSAVMSAPFVRPALDDLLKAVDMAADGYPARGELDVRAVA